MPLPRHHPRIREALAGYTRGRTVAELSKELGTSPGVLWRSLRSMQDAYIQSWYLTDRGRYAARWNVAKVPEDAPMPGEAP